MGLVAHLVKFQLFPIRAFTIKHGKAFEFFTELAGVIAWIDLFPFFVAVNSDNAIADDFWHITSMAFLFNLSSKSLHINIAAHIKGDMH